LRSRYFYVAGRRIDVRAGDGDRVSTVIERGGSRVAALVALRSMTATRAVGAGAVMQRWG
jgi:hypothetical protein